MVRYRQVYLHNAKLPWHRCTKIIPGVLEHTFPIVLRDRDLSVKKPRALYSTAKPSPAAVRLRYWGGIFLQAWILARRVGGGDEREAAGLLEKVGAGLNCRTWIWVVTGCVTKGVHMPSKECRGLIRNAMLSSAHPSPKAR